MGDGRTPELSAFCAEVEDQVQVQVTYHLNSQTTLDGHALWMTLRVENGMSQELQINIGGAVGVTA